MDLELAHKRKEAATKWRQGKAINRQTFLGWHKSFALKNKKEENSSANAFLASGKTTSSQSASAPHRGCVLHGEQAIHGTIDCKAVAWADTKKWSQACKSFHVCSRCLIPWVPQHHLNCAAKCSRCQGSHHAIRCGKDTKAAFSFARKRAASSKPEDEPHPKRGRTEGKEMDKRFEQLAKSQEAMQKSIQALADRETPAPKNRRDKPAQKKKSKEKK